MFSWSRLWLAQPELINFLIYFVGLNNWSECAFLNIVSYIGRKTVVAEDVISVQFDAFIFSVAKLKYFALKAEQKA